MLTGRCSCGEVSFEVSGNVKRMYHCHCDSCRKQNGASYTTMTEVNADYFQLVSGRESITVYEKSPEYHIHFCSRCGSRIFGQHQEYRDYIYVPGGAYNEDPQITPEAHYFVGSKAPWTKISDDIPQFEKHRE